MQQIPHDIVLHLNNKWHVMLVSETQANSIRFDSQQFELMKQDQGNLWLTGTGELHWREHIIRVSDLDLKLNNTQVSTSSKALTVHLFFYPDGRVLKGKADLK